MKYSAVFLLSLLVACSAPGKSNNSANNGSNNGSNNGDNNGENNGENNGQNNGGSDMGADGSANNGQNNGSNNEPGVALVVGETDFTTTDPTFVPLDRDFTLEIVSGFQGGWHVEPTVRIMGTVPTIVFEGTLTVVLTDRDDVELVSPSGWELDPQFWGNLDDPPGRQFHLPPMQFPTDDITPFVDSPAILDVTVEWESPNIPTLHERYFITLVDQVEELGGRGDMGGFDMGDIDRDAGF